MKQLPDKFKENMKNLLGSEFNDYINAVNGNAVKGFRVNTDKISIEEFEKINIFGNKKIPYVENGYYLEYEKVGNHPFHHAGMIYVQEPAAMAPAECLKIKDDWKILDMCAAPGGKSTQLKNKLSKNGVLVSNEIISGRCKILTGNIERLGLKNTITTCMDTTRLAKEFPKMFDMIMVDAPCSGEGMFRKDDTAILEWSEENVIRCAQRQAKILDDAVKCLKDSGYIVYATCTFSLLENEMTIDSFLQRHPEFTLVPVENAVLENTCDGISYSGCKNNNLNLCRRFYPHKNKGEGQFMAVLYNTLPPTVNTRTKLSAVKTEKIVYDFLNETLLEYNKDEVTVYNNKPVIISNAVCLKNGVAFSCGVTIGEIKKNYILPHHQFFMAFGNSFKRKINFNANDENLKKFLHGEEFYTHLENGWAVVTVNGCAVGGIKVSGGVAKNHYPKGLRTL